MINHRYTNIFTGITLLSFVAISNVAAQDSSANNAKELSNALFKGWSGTAILGATSASGNSDASNINGGLRIGKIVGRWEHLAFLSIFKGTSAIVVEDRDSEGNVIIGDDGRPQRSIIKGENSDRLAIGYQPKFYWRPKTYVFGLLDYEQDKPANINSGTRQIAGIGHKFYINERGFLSGEVGLGNKNTNLVFGDDINGGVGYLGLNFLNRLNDNATVNVDLRTDFGSDNTFIELGLGLAFKLTSNLAFKIAHFTRSNTDIDSGGPFNSKSDSVTTMNLVIDI